MPPASRFGAFLVFTGVKMWWAGGQEPDLDSNPALRWINRHLAVSPRYDGELLQLMSPRK